MSILHSIEMLFGLDARELAGVRLGEAFTELYKNHFRPPTFSFVRSFGQRRGRS